MMKKVWPWQSAGWRPEIEGGVASVRDVGGAAAAVVPAPEVPAMGEQRRSWQNPLKRGRTASSSDTVSSKEQ